MIRTLPQRRRGFMRSTLRGPLGWALAAGLVLATACNSVGTPGATSSPTKTARIGGLDRPIQLAFTPSTQAATISTNGAAVKSALEKATGLRINVTVMTSYAAQVEAMGAGGHAQAARAVYQGTVDGAATFIDARDSLVATTPDIKTKTKVIDTAGPIPNDGVALAKNFPDDIAKQVKDALIAYSKADDGKKVFTALFSWDGIQEISPSFYDDMKTAAALAGVDVQGLANATPKPAATTAAPSKSP